MHMIIFIYICKYIYLLSRMGDKIYENIHKTELGSMKNEMEHYFVEFKKLIEINKFNVVTWGLG